MDIKKIKGATLISVIIGLGLTGFLTIAIVQTVSISKNQMKFSNTAANLADRSMFIHNFIYDTVSLAGYRGFARSLPSGAEAVLQTPNVLFHNQNGTAYNFTRGAAIGGGTVTMQPGVFIAPYNKTHDEVQGVIIAFQGSPSEDFPVRGRLFDASGQELINRSGITYIAITVEVENYDPAIGNNRTVLVAYNDPPPHTAPPTRHVIDRNVVQFAILFGLSSDTTIGTTETHNIITRWVTDVKDPNTGLHNPSIARSIRAVRFILVLGSDSHHYTTEQNQRKISISRANDINFGGSTREKLELVNVFIPLKHQFPRQDFDAFLFTPF